MSDIDLAAVAARMVDLENDIPQADPREDVPVYEVVAKLLEIDPEGVDAAMLRETNRAHELCLAYYGPRFGVGGEHPAILGAISFVQGVTFARAVADVRRREDGTV